MFGRNPLMKQDLGDGKSLRIVDGSPWSTIQGEGPFAGARATFIRLHGCNLACTFCDTDFSNPNDPVVPITELVEKVMDMPAELVVITGGEPLRQNIVPLCRALFLNGKQIQIETAGTLWIDELDKYVEFVVSPKTPTIRPEIYKKAFAFKYVVDHRMEFSPNTHLPITNTQGGPRVAQLAESRPGSMVFASPMDCYNEEDNAKNRKLVAQMAMDHGFIAGLQLHKYLDVA